MSKFGALLEQYVPDETFEVNIVDIGAEENCQAWTFKGIRDVATRKAWDSDAYKWATSKRVKDAVEAMGINPESCLESIRSAWYWAQTFVKSSTGDDKMTPAEALEFLRAPDLFQNINHQWERGQKTVNSRYLHALIEESKKFSNGDTQRFVVAGIRSAGSRPDDVERFGMTWDEYLHQLIALEVVEYEERTAIGVAGTIGRALR